MLKVLYKEQVMLQNYAWEHSQIVALQQVSVMAACCTVDRQCSWISGLKSLKFSQVSVEFCA